MAPRPRLGRPLPQDLWIEVGRPSKHLAISLVQTVVGETRSNWLCRECLGRGTAATNGRGISSRRGVQPESIAYGCSHVGVCCSLMSDPTPPRRRGPNRGSPWQRDPDEPVAVIRLALDLSDPHQRRRLEQLYQAVFSLRRALQRQAGRRCRAYWAAGRERAGKGGAQVRRRLGLSRAGFEQAAYSHMERSRHLGHHLTKAVAMHAADQVWESASRHLFLDSGGHRVGAPGPGRWWDFQTIPGRIPLSASGRRSGWWARCRGIWIATEPPACPWG